MTVVHVDALQVVAGGQVLQRGVGDQRAVVQLQHGQRLGGTAARRQLPDALVRDQFAVGQRELLQTGTAGGQVGECLVGDLAALLQIHALQVFAVLDGHKNQALSTLIQNTEEPMNVIYLMAHFNKLQFHGFSPLPHYTVSWCNFYK